MPVLETSHDFAHAVEDDQAWSESYLFGGYDPENDAGLHSRIGIRPNEGTMDLWLDVWLPEASFAHHIGVREQHEMTDTGLEVGAVRFERLEAMNRWRIVGEAVGDLRSHNDPHTRGREVSIAVDAVFDALTPPIGAYSKPESGGPKGNFHAGHFEQAGRWHGWVEVDGTHFEFGREARGIRDKSWGPRRWEKMRMWRWFALNFGDDVHLGATRIATPSGDLHRGWLWKGNDFTTIRHLDIQTDFEDRTMHPVRSSVTARDKTGEIHEFEGEMIWVAEPEIHGTWSERSGRTVIHMGLGRWTYNGKTGYGFCDYAHHLDEFGHPTIPIE